MTRRSWSCGAGLRALVACGLWLAWSHVSFAAMQTYVYTPPEWPVPLSGDWGRPDGEGAVPAVLLVHGGAWSKGHRGQMHRFGAALVKQGYAAFSIDYRLVPAAHYPEQLEDVLQALRWLRINAGTLGIDFDRIGIMGYSAGAHLAMQAALTSRDRSTPVRVVIAGGMPADLIALGNLASVRALIGGTLVTAPQQYRKASPLFQMLRGAPPVFLSHGLLDRLVPPAQAERMKAALDQYGVPSELVLIEGADHGRAAAFPGEAAGRAAAFLERYLKPQPPAASRSN